MTHEDKGSGDRPEEEVADEVIDLEAFSKTGKRPPRARAYRFKVNEDVFEWPKPVITGREVLTLAGLTPPENYSLRLKTAGGKPRKIDLDDKVDLREPGVEKFRAIRKDQNDGEYQGRRDAPLLDSDEAFLKNYGLAFDVVADGSTWIILRDYSLPDGFTEKKVSVAIRMEQGYPLTALDMMYVFPALRRLDGKAIPQSETMQAIEGKQYQRWSRHRTGDNPWVPNKDSIETHVYLIEEWFARETAR